MCYLVKTKACVPVLQLALAGQTGGIPVLPNPLADAYTAALMGPRSYSGFPQSQSIRTVKVYVPNNMVGAIIGSKVIDFVFMFLRESFAISDRKMIDCRVRTFGV